MVDTATDEAFPWTILGMFILTSSYKRTSLICCKSWTRLPSHPSTLAAVGVAIAWFAAKLVT
eukprot:10704332-Prorocentrum_lima.AAC.1